MQIFHPTLFFFFFSQRGEQSCVRMADFTCSWLSGRHVHQSGFLADDAPGRGWSGRGPGAAAEWTLSWGSELQPLGDCLGGFVGRVRDLLCLKCFSYRTIIVRYLTRYLTTIVDHTTGGQSPANPWACRHQRTGWWEAPADRLGCKFT